MKLFSLFKVSQHNKTMGIQKRSAIVRFGGGGEKTDYEGGNHNHV